MKLTITFKLQPESVEELEKLPLTYVNYRDQAEEWNLGGGYGFPKDKVELRWLLSTKVFHES